MIWASNNYVLIGAATGVVAISWALFLVFRRRQAKATESTAGSAILLWIGGFAALWLLSAVAVHLWFIAGGFYWWRIDTWLSSAGELNAQAARGVKSASELRIEEVRNLLGAVAIVAGSLVGAVQIGNSLHRTRLQERERDADERRLRGDRERLEGDRQARNADVFSRAVQQLAEPDDARMASRIGAIYSLEALARSQLGPDVDVHTRRELAADEQDRSSPLVGQIIETLAAFVRQRSVAARALAPDGAAPPDIAIAVRVIAGIPPYWRPTFVNDLGVDLRGAHLAELELPKFSDLRRFNLERATLSRARIVDADLSGVRMARANLKDAVFGRSVVENIDLKSATLDGAHLALVEGLRREQLEAAASRIGVEMPVFKAEPEATGGAQPRPTRGERGAKRRAQPRPTHITPEEAILTILMTSAMADGAFAAEEQAEMLGIVRQSALLRRLPPADLARLNQVVMQRLQSNPTALEEACAALPVEMAEPIFERAVDLCLVDGAVVAAERDFLNRLAEMLEIPDFRSRQIVEQSIRRAQI